MNRLIPLLCATFLLGRAQAQSPDSALSVYNAQFPQEKIHIHFDKDAYLPGETVWMRAYLMSGSRPSDLTKSLYFDWTDADGRLLLHSIAPVTEGGASSFFQIPAWVKNGVIHLKAYSQWMLNFDNAFLFNKDIPVLMPAEASNPVVDIQQTTVHFFPEGGDLIKGVSSLVAFEALNQHNQPVPIRGALKNDKNVIIDSFQTSSKGWGSVRLKPAGNERYTAYWIDDSGDTHTTMLPEARPNGLVLHVDPFKNGQFHYKLIKSADASKLKRIILVGTMQQKVVYRSSLVLESSTGEGNLPAANLPAGILQLTAFDANLCPLAERVVFVNNQKSYAKLLMRKESVSLNKRARNVISLEIPDSLATRVSISVTDAGLGSDSSNNIYSDLLLTGELKGEIPDAASFLVDSGNANENLNLLLMTHGWRRFNWESVVSGKFPDPKYSRDDDFLSIRGEIKFSTDLDQHDSVAMLLISRDRKKHVLKLQVDNHGKFTQNGLFFYDSVQVVYRFNNLRKLNSNGQIFLNSDLLPALTAAKADDPSFSWVKVPEVILEKEMNGNLIETRDQTTASNAMIYVVTPQGDSLGKNSESAAHYLTDNFDGLRFPATLKENSAGSNSRLASYHAYTAPRNNVNVTIDGSPVAMDELRTVNMKEVLFIKFLPATGGKGLPTLAITSRQALEQAHILENKTGFAVINGYTPLREFYQPRYDDRVVDRAATDFRSTLYWNPKLKLDKTHRKMNFVFYNNDITNKFRVVVEGMNQDGKLIRIEEIIK